MESEIDLLHPLSVNSLKWKDCKSMPVGMKDAQSVWFEGKLYVGGGTAKTIKDSAKLYIYTPNEDSWVSIDTPVYNFALCIYESTIALIGGRIYDEDKPASGHVTNMVYMLRKSTTSWVTCNSMMKVRRCGASAISINDFLIVSGGECETSCLTVEVLCGNEWLSIKLPNDLNSSDVKMVQFKDDVYLMSKVAVYHFSVSSLNDQEILASDSSIWKRLPNLPKLAAGGSPVVFGCNLFVHNGGILYAYSPYNQSWIRVQDVPNSQLYRACVAVIASRELVIIGGVSSTTEDASDKVSKASIEVPWMTSLKMKFTLKGLSLLEKVYKIPILSKLRIKKYKSRFFRVITYRQSADVEDALQKWLTDGVTSKIEPTWINLMHVLHLSDLKPIANQIYKVLSEYLEPQQKNDPIHNELDFNNSFSSSSRSASPISDDGLSESQYVAKIFCTHRRSKCPMYEIDIVVTKNVQDHLSCVKEEYDRAHPGPYQFIEFDDDVITLEMSIAEGSEKWKLTPSVHPTISKMEVDGYERGKVIPHCQFVAKYPIEERNAPDVTILIKLIGAKRHSDDSFYFNLHLPIKDIVSPRKRHSPNDSDQGSVTKRRRVDELSLIAESEPLKIKDALKILLPVADEWENIGILLGVEDSDLRTIKSNNPNNCRGCLREMLRKWLSIVDPQPTWSVLFNAVTDLGMKEIANTIT